MYVKEQGEEIATFPFKFLNICLNYTLTASLLFTTTLRNNKKKTSLPHIMLTIKDNLSLS